MKKIDNFDYELAEKMQQAAASRVASLSKNIKKFDRPKNPSLLHRHRDQWRSSWEDCSFEEVEITKDLIHECLCSFIDGPITNFTLNISNGAKSKTHILTAKELELEEQRLDEEIRYDCCKLELLENANDEKILPESIWSELLKLSTESLEAVIVDIINVFWELQSKKFNELNKYRTIENEFYSTRLKSRTVLELVQSIWAPSLHANILLSNDLKNLICGKNKKMRQELISLERIYLNKKQQKIKLRSLTNQAQTENRLMYQMILTMKENEQKRFQELDKKISDARQFNSYRMELKNKILELREQRDKNLRIEEIKIIELEERNAQIRKKQMEVERAERDKARSEIKKWRQVEDEKLAEIESFKAMEEFERRQGFLENLPLLKEAADRREKLRLEKINRAQTEMEEIAEERQKKQDILDRLRAKVSVTAEVDPARLIQNTENWRHRNLQRENSSSSILGKMNSYTDSQLMKDKRLQFEVLLRSNNIPINSYALETLKSFNPATQPRKDNLHTNLYN